MSKRIPYTRPSITELEIDFVNDAATNGWGASCYDYIVKFEENFASYIGCKHAVATSSCTGAITLGLAALGIGPDDEVILADTNWIATVAPVVHLGATPIFVDVLEETWCLDPMLVRQSITSKTKAIIVTHLYGNLANLTELIQIGQDFNIPIIEDAAEAIGSRFGGQLAGSFGRFGVFSFHGTKTLSTGEGGMLITNDSSLYEDVLTLNNHGRSRVQSRQFWPDKLGYKFKMSNIQAALGCAQLKRVEVLVSRKQEILRNYRELLSNFSTVRMNFEGENHSIGAWMPTVVFEEKLAIDISLLLANFERENIDGRVFFPPLSSLPMFKDKTENVISYGLPNRAINLPSFHDMTFENQQEITDIISNVVNEAMS
jgi:perosamine synthetase